MRRAALVLAILALGCERKQEFAGIGPYTFTRTTVGDVTQGMCQPTTLDDGRTATWCHQLRGISVAGSPTEVHLYFGGTDKSAKLIEIQLMVRGCNEEALDSWMTQQFGPAIDRRANRGYWKNSFLWAAALMPSEAGRCLVHLLPPSEAAEIDRIKKK